ncbi:MAG: hypothetical protein ABFS37_08770 [Acidobacteriota bacterium]
MHSKVQRFSVLVAVVLLGSAAVFSGERTRLRFEKTVGFKLDTTVELHAEVGPLFIESVEFENRGAGTTKSKIFGVLRRSGSADTTVTLRCAFDVENPVKDEWDLTATIEFLDKRGELIDRVRSSRDFEGEADTWTIDHDILGYVIPLIDDVKIELQVEAD